MRIIAGTCKGRRLSPIKGSDIRPTSDRVREAVFNILGVRVKGAVVLDLFAGTGALGIEALSRGAAAATFVDHRQPALTLVRRNLDACGLSAKARLICRDIRHGLDMFRGKRPPFDLVFMDPPYHTGCLMPALIHLESAGCLAADAWVVIEHDPREAVVADDLHLLVTDTRRYGGTWITFLSIAGGPMAATDPISAERIDGSPPLWVPETSGSAP